MGIVNIDHEYKNHELQLYVSERNNDVKHIREIAKGYLQYYYIPKRNEFEIDELPTNIGEAIHVEKTDKKSIYDDELLKISFDKDVEKFYYWKSRKHFSITFEADLHDVGRYLIDNNVTYDDNQRIHYIDIETNMCLDTLETPEPIIAITAYDSIDKQYLTWLWHPTEIIQRENCICFDNEVDMLNAHLNYIKQTNPDIITGWNVEDFDMCYLIRRLGVVGIDASKLCPKEMFRAFVRTWEYKSGEVRQEPEIAGREIIDLMATYKKITYENKPSSYALNAVAKHELGKEKIEISSVSKLWKEDLNTLIDYNIRDVELIVELDEHNHLMKRNLILQQIGQLPLRFVKHNSMVVDRLMLRRNRDKVFPTKIRRDKFETPEGALCGQLYRKPNGEWDTKAPAPGIYKNVAVFDFAAMYPSIYRTFNISSEVISKNGDININGVRFDSRKTGILPSMISELIERRKKIKEKMSQTERGSREFYALKNLQGSVKQIANSVFGVSGYPSFRLYNLNVLKSILFIGRQMIIDCVQKAEEQGYNVLYCDTDSLMIELKSDNIDGQLIEVDTLENEFNNVMQHIFPAKYYPAFKKSYLRIDCEKIFSSLVFFGVKKKYIGTLSWFEGEETDIIFQRGVSIVKHDTPMPFKPILRRLTLMMINNASIDEITRYMFDSYEKIRQLSAWNIGMSKNIAKNFGDYKNKTELGNSRKLPYHVRAAIYSNEKFGTNFSRGDMPKIVYVRHPMTDVIALENDEQQVPKEYQVDYTQYIKKHIIRYVQDFIPIRDELIKIPGVTRLKKKSIEDEAQQKLVI